jgi:hypothetical protein
LKLLWCEPSGSCVASRTCSLPLSLPVHLIPHVVNHNCTIDKSLKVGVGVGHKLKPQVVI